MIAKLFIISPVVLLFLFSPLSFACEVSLRNVPPSESNPLPDNQPLFLLDEKIDSNKPLIRKEVVSGTRGSFLATDRYDRTGRYLGSVLDLPFGYSLVSIYTYHEEKLYPFLRKGEWSYFSVQNTSDNSLVSSKGKVIAREYKECDTRGMLLNTRIDGSKFLAFSILDRLATFLGFDQS